VNEFVKLHENVLPQEPHHYVYKVLAQGCTQAVRVLYQRPRLQKKNIERSFKKMKKILKV
jgi:hypothetical protein